MATNYDNIESLESILEDHIPEDKLGYVKNILYGKSLK